MEAKHIATNLELSDRIECIAKSPSFVTLKDHKDNFRSNPTCRLINPSKNELGKVSKKLVENINCSIIEKLKLNQWKNTDAVLSWFDNISEKRNCKFVQFDIKDFYPSITENILNNAFDFAKQHVNIDENNLRIIKHCQKSLLFHDNETWKKKTTDSCFDVTMGSFDGAEICQLVGLYIQSTYFLLTSVVHQDATMKKHDHASYLCPTYKI